MTNATDDGALGMTVDAWRDGIASVTGQPYTTPARGAVVVLVRALNKHCPADSEPVEWSKRVASEYATARRDRTLSPFDFADWMASGKPEAPSGVRRAAPRSEENPNPVSRAPIFSKDEIKARIQEAKAEAKSK